MNLYLESEARSSTRGQRFRLGRHGCYVVALESVLLGHDDWVLSVAWQPTIEIQGTFACHHAQ